MTPTIKIKESDSPALKKKKQFAINFRKKEFGGYIEGNSYDLSMEQIKQLEKQGYILKY